LTLIEEYKIQRPLNFGEVRKIRVTMSAFAEANEKLDDAKDLTPDEVKRVNSLIVKSGEADQIVADMLVACYGISQEELDAMNYADATKLFGRLYQESTTVKKNSNQPYG